MTFKRSYWSDVLVTLHLPRAACFYAFVVIGTFLSPVIHWDRLILSLLATFCFLQLTAYAVDELKGRHCGTTIPDKHYRYRAIIGLIGAWAIAIYLGVIINYTMFILAVFGAFMILGYNYEVLGLHSRLVFMFSWGFFPLVSNYYLHLLLVPTLTVIIWGVVAMVFAYLHIISYGNFSCKVSTCKDKPRDDCHGNLCEIRRYGITRETHRLQRKIANYEVLMLLVLTLVVIISHYGW